VAVKASEDFTGANGTALPVHDARWTECEGSFSLQSNAVICDAFGASLFAAAGWNGCTFDADQWSEAVVASIQAGQFTGVTARCDITGPTATYYLFWATTTATYLQKLVAGAQTSLAGPVAGGVVVGDVLRIECEGTTIRCKKNGTTVISVTDASIATGAPGIGTFWTNPSFRLDDWAGGDLDEDAMDPWDAQRSSPQTSKLYLVIQQPQYSTDDSTWTGYDWSCRIDGDPVDDPIAGMWVDGGGAAVDLLDGQTVLIGSSYGAWDKAITYVRGDQSVGPATNALYIGTNSDVRGHVEDDDYVVVLDEFRLWQRFGRIEVSGDEIIWYKDYDIEWDDLGAADAGRRLAMMPPTPVMGPHAVKFVEIGDSGTAFYWDWSDSYAVAPGETIATWTSEGETDHAGGVWNSAAETPGWKMVDAISGLRGFRTVLEVDDGNGNATTLPYRRGVRYCFTLRRPGETQVGDPANAEPITEFEMAEPISGSAEQGYWRTSITVFESEASKYNIMPEALVVLFTEDRFTDTDGTPYNRSVGPITDRENILFVGRIVDGTIRKNPETGDVTFDVASPGAEAAMYHNYSIVIQNDDAGTSWIDTPDLTVDRAVHYYTTWHTTLKLIADLYQTGSTIEIYAMDFLEGTIYNTLNSFLHDRLFARMLCDKYGRLFCEIDAQDQAFGTVTGLFTLQSTDWLDEVTVRQRIQVPVSAVDCGGLIYTAGADPPVTPKLSRAPGLYTKHRGARQESTSLAIVSQDALNTSCGRHLQGLNYEFDMDLSLAGNWRYCDIAPQRVVNIGTFTTHRQTLTGNYILRAVSNSYDPSVGVIFTDIQLEEEMDDGVPGVTIPIPDEMPDKDYEPSWGSFPPGFGGIIPIGDALVPGEPPAAMGGPQFYVTQQFDTEDYWTDDITANPPVWNLLDHLDEKNKTTMMYSATTNRFFGYGWGIWEYSPLPFDTGAWSEIYDEEDLAAFFGHDGDYFECYIFKMEFSIRPGQEGWAWAGVCLYYDDGTEHRILGCLHTRNAWASVTYTTELSELDDGVNWEYTNGCELLECGLALDMHSNTVYIVDGKAPEQDGLGVATYDGWWRLYRSQNFGFTFTLAQEETFTWGVDGYEHAGYNDGTCDVWVPWVSNSYVGGAVFWTANMLDTGNNAFAIEYEPLIFRSLNHGLSYENIGDDGTLTHGLNFIGGPYNSLHRVYGGLSMPNAKAADATEIWTWRSGYAWTLFRDSALGAYGNFRGWIVGQQTGYALTSGFAYQEPYFVESGSETDKVCTEDDVFWQTWVVP